VQDGTAQLIGPGRGPYRARRLAVLGIWATDARDRDSDVPPGQPAGSPGHRHGRRLADHRPVRDTGQAVLIALEYATTTPRDHSLAAAARANALASNPPVRDSATASVRPPCFSAAPARPASCSRLRCVSLVGMGHYPPQGGILASGGAGRVSRPALLTDRIAAGGTPRLRARTGVKRTVWQAPHPASPSSRSRPARRPPEGAAPPGTGGPGSRPRR
jgi:hypothetical protein